VSMNTITVCSGKTGWGQERLLGKCGIGLDGAEWRSEEENVGMKVCELYTTSLN
jgi:hypothetical protein